MKFSKMQSALKHKYRNEADPALLEKQRFWNKLVYSAAAVLLITAVVLNILSAGRAGYCSLEHSSDTGADHRGSCGPVL